MAAILVSTKASRKRYTVVSTLSSLMAPRFFIAVATCIGFAPFLPNVLCRTGGPTHTSRSA